MTIESIEQIVTLILIDSPCSQKILCSDIT